MASGNHQCIYRHRRKVVRKGWRLNWEKGEGRKEEDMKGRDREEGQQI